VQDQCIARDFSPGYAAQRKLVSRRQGLQHLGL
jgi:hypothetical protein